MNRAKKLRIFQFTLLLTGLLIVFFTYFQIEGPEEDKIITKADQKKIESKLKNQQNSDNVFFNVQYSGIDLEGNRYTIKSEEAINSKSDNQIVNMTKVHATFFFKDNTVLNVYSNYAKYNNKTLDMIFNEKVEAIYENTKLFAEKAEFSNSKSFLTISEKVKVNDPRGTMFADKLFFDIKKKTLDIASINDKKVNTIVKYK